MLKITPLITEKTLLLAKSHRYTFAVPLQVSKYQAKSAIEALYSVNVLKITTSIIPGTTRRHQKGYRITTPAQKKATVQVKPDQTIAAFELKTQ